MFFKVIWTLYLLLNSSSITKHKMVTTTPTTPSSVAKPMRRFIKPAIVVGAVAGGILATPLVVPVALGTVGFSSTGVVGGSIAAGLQAQVGNVVAGSAFAACQSMAMGGSFSSVATVASGTAGGLIGFVGTRVFGRKKRDNNNKPIAKL
jgi:hypothetical protein